MFGRRPLTRSWVILLTDRMTERTITLLRQPRQSIIRGAWAVVRLKCEKLLWANGHLLSRADPSITAKPRRTAQVPAKENIIGSSFRSAEITPSDEITPGYILRRLRPPSLIRSGVRVSATFQKVPRLMGRLGSGVRVSVSSQNFLQWIISREISPGGNISWIPSFRHV